MSGRVERVLRVVSPDEPRPVSGSYWHTRSMSERLEEAFRLHDEGNALFAAGKTRFEFCIEVRHGDRQR